MNIWGLHWENWNKVCNFQMSRVGVGEGMIGGRKKINTKESKKEKGKKQT